MVRPVNVLQVSQLSLLRGWEGTYGGGSHSPIPRPLLGLGTRLGGGMLRIRSKTASYIHTV